MTSLARWFAPVVIAAALGTGATFSAPARADDDLVRVIVDIADVVIRSGHPYYRHGGYGYGDRLIVSRDRYGRPVYYRMVPRGADRYGPPYGNAYGYRDRGPHRYDRYQRSRCDSRGRCRVEYYDPRQDRRRYDDRYDYGYGYGDRHHDRRRHDD